MIPDLGVIRVTGIDLSLRSTGIARITIRDHDVQTWTGTIGSTGEAKETLRQRCYRLDALVDGVDVEVGSPDLAVIEAPSFGSQFGHPHDRSGAWWLLVHRLWARGIPLAQVAPTTLKKYLAEHGSAGKGQMVAAARRDAPCFDVPTGSAGYDVADAIGLALLGAHHLGHPLLDRPDTALAAVKWPVPQGVPA